MPNRGDSPQTPDSHPAADSPPEKPPRRFGTRPRSPIRPHPGSSPLKPPQPRLVPAKPPTAPLAEDETLPSSPTRPDSPQQALERLRQRMSAVAGEFADGKINRAQFHAIYNRYSEQRRIIESIIAHDPNSQAWQQAARPGHTGFLRQHFQARVNFFALFAYRQAKPIIHHGSDPPSAKIVQPVMRSLPGYVDKHGIPAPGRRRLDNGQWLVVVPGQYTVTMVVYTLEPAAAQISGVEDLHTDFEQANLEALARADFRPERLVFPQRALLDA